MIYGIAVIGLIGIVLVGICICKIMIVQTINEYQFADAFRAANRSNQFSHSGLRALFASCEQHSEDTGEDVELDVIAICVQFSEYESLEFALSTYDYSAACDGDGMEWLAERTTVISLANGGIILEDF